VRGFRNPKLSVAVYLGMGWVVVIAVKPLLAHVAPAGIAWLLAGGLCYTGGVAFYALDHKRYVHSVWHLFVLAGSACHFAAVWLYSAGRTG
jgi:hemolysin III